MLPFPDVLMWTMRAALDEPCSGSVWVIFPEAENDLGLTDTFRYMSLCWKTENIGIWRV